MKIDVIQAPPGFFPGEVVHGFGTAGASGDVLGAGCRLPGMAHRPREDPFGVDENHRRFLERLGVPDLRLYVPRQVHGDVLVEIDAHTPWREPPAADALMTERPGMMIGVLTADCVPILLAGPGIVAAVHAGWRGTVRGIVAGVIQTIREKKAIPPSELVGVIGPSIGPECYPVGPEVADALRERVGGSGPIGESCLVDGRLDLKKANLRLMLDAGMVPARVHVIPLCVSCDPRFFSFRRDRGQTGRMLNAIGIRAS